MTLLDAFMQGSMWVLAVFIWGAASLSAYSEAQKKRLYGTVLFLIIALVADAFIVYGFYTMIQLGQLS